MGLSHTSFRRSFWADNVLWKEYIQHHRVTLVLAGRDVTIDAKSIGAYLTNSDDWPLETRGWKDGLWKFHSLDVLWFEDLDYGQVFDEKMTRSRLVEIVGRFCEEQPDASG